MHPGDLPALLAAAHAHLAASPARLLAGDAEDLWPERVPQNRPGTAGCRTFSGRRRRALEDLEADGAARRQLAGADAARHGTGAPS